MSTDNLMRILTIAINGFPRPESLKNLFRQHRDGNPLSFGKVLGEIIGMLRLMLFTGFSGNTAINISAHRYYVKFYSDIFRLRPSYQMEAGLWGMCR